MRLDNINQSQPAGYLLKLQLFIRGDQDAHIVLSASDSSQQPNISNYNIVRNDQAFEKAQISCKQAKNMSYSNIHYMKIESKI